ncbi:50S ribosomal protein L15 [Candidatus Parcubacteria bacterium]|nr:MAG: 50S ribosomal protein L15 [Candidatus Parcubacteria bacterium]
MNLSNLSPKTGSRRKKIRVGRGNASGHGTFSGRGIKGQRARSGGRKRLARRGLKQMLLQLPKARGFQSLDFKFKALNLEELNKYFQAGEKVDLAALQKVKLIKTNDFVKILGQGELKKPLQVWAHAFSKSAEAAITKAGGAANRIAFPAQPKPKRQADKLKA